VDNAQHQAKQRIIKWMIAVGFLEHTPEHKKVSIVIVEIDGGSSRAKEG
jgi:hypothetical protein